MKKQTNIPYQELREEALLLFDKLLVQYLPGEPFSQKQATEDHAETLDRTSVEHHLKYLEAQGLIERLNYPIRNMYRIVEATHSLLEGRLDDFDPES